MEKKICKNFLDFFFLKVKFFFSTRINAEVFLVCFPFTIFKVFIAKLQVPMTKRCFTASKFPKALRHSTKKFKCFSKSIPKSIWIFWNHQISFFFSKLNFTLLIKAVKYLEICLISSKKLKLFTESWTFFPRVNIVLMIIGSDVGCWCL